MKDKSMMLLKPRLNNQKRMEEMTNLKKKNPMPMRRKMSMEMSLTMTSLRKMKMLVCRG